MGVFYGRPYYNASEALDKTNYQTFTPNANVFLKALRTWVVVYNDPTFTSLSANVYEDDGGLPGALLMSSSNSHTKASLIGANTNALRGVYFTFTNDIILRSADVYHLVLKWTGASGFSETAHVGWIQDVYDPVYAAAQTANQIQKSPFNISIVASEIE